MKTILKNSWQKLLLQEPNLRIRDAAIKLQTSEAQLLALNLGQGVQLLQNNFTGILIEAESLGRVMALTRNAHCVHERKGVYKGATFSGPMGLIATEDIDLRLFMSHWHYGFAVSENGRHSLQFFNSYGEAVHKIFLVAESNLDAYNALVSKFLAPVQEFGDQLPQKPAPTPAVSDGDIDIQAFRTGWLALQDTHDFFGLMRKHKVQRQQAMRIAPAGHTRLLPAETIVNMLQHAASTNMPIMVFTGSTGCIQIHTGPVHKLMATGPWFNVLDEAFSMHLRTTGISGVWAVKKPTADGYVHSLEVYDNEGELIVQFFGKRKPGQPELTEWTQYVSALLHSSPVTA